MKIRRRTSRPREEERPRRTSRPSRERPRRVAPNLGEGSSSLLLAERLVAETAHEPLTANRTGRLRGASMDTKFGADVDPDDVSGGALDAAMDRYEIFHDKAPIRVAELDHEVPQQWRHDGDALGVMYRTDKWKADGTDEDYKHLHDAGDDKPYPVNRGVKIYTPSPQGQRLPVARPKAVALLGYCLGVFVRKDDSEIYEANPRGCYLFSSPSGNLLLMYSPQKQPNGSSGFLAALCGGKLRVLKDGIDG